MNTIESNINNLTQLWKVAGQTFQGYHADEGIHSSSIQNSEWPNRIWINEPFSKEVMGKLQGVMSKNKALTFSYFNTESKNSPSISEDHLDLKWIQYGMSLRLASKFKSSKKIEFVRVTNNSEAKAWNSTFYRAFNYQISPETILKTKSEIPHFLIYHEKELIGTIVMYTTHKTMGLHSLGIDPAHRKKGYATEIMYHALNMGIDQNLPLATLQASEMAKSMYLKMGFSVDFLMENYQLEHQNI